MGVRRKRPTRGGAELPKRLSHQIREYNHSVQYFLSLVSLQKNNIRSVWRTKKIIIIKSKCYLGSSLGVIKSYVKYMQSGIRKA